MNEVVEKIREKLELMSDQELNALVLINFDHWRQSAETSAWNPAGNAGHAHDLTAKLLQDGLYVNLIGRPDEWTCEIMDKQAKIYAEIASQTLPRAVCEAALITILTKYGQMIKV